MEWKTLNERWRYKIDVETSYIYPEGKDGKTIRVTLHRRLLTLKAESNGCCRVIKHHLHRKEWHWQLDGKPSNEVDIRNLITVMSNREKAIDLLKQI